MHLFLDTSLPACTMAFIKNEQIWHKTDAEPRPSGRIHGHLIALLEEAGATLTDVTDVVVTRGPGSFTGVRVGLAIAMGLQQSLGSQVQIRPLSTLQALAASIVAAHKPNEPFMIALDSLTNEAYIQTFTAEGVAMGEISCVTPADFTVPEGMPVYGNALTLLKTEGTSAELNPAAILAWGNAHSWDDSLSPLYIKPLTFRKINAA